MVHVAKINAWLLKQLGVPKRRQRMLANFSKEIAEGLMLANKLLNDQTKSCERLKQQSIKTVGSGWKKPAIATPCSVISFDEIRCWPIPTADKKQCHACQSYSRMTCEKYKILLHLEDSQNCFKTFHHQSHQKSCYLIWFCYLFIEKFHKLLYIYNKKIAHEL